MKLFRAKTGGGSIFLFWDWADILSFTWITTYYPNLPQIILTYFKSCQKLPQFTQGYPKLLKVTQKYPK